MYWKVKFGAFEDNKFKILASENNVNFVPIAELQATESELYQFSLLDKYAFYTIQVANKNSIRYTTSELEKNRHE